MDLKAGFRVRSITEVARREAMVGLFCRRVVACLGIALASPDALAQSTWLPTTGTFAWTTSGSWGNGVVPNSTGATAVFPNGGVTVSLVATTVKTGTINATNGSGNVVFGDASTTDDIINLDVASGSPAVSVNSGALVYMYASLTGSQGFTKSGGGTLSFRYNPVDMVYTGTVSLGGGTTIINQNGSLGDAANPIVITANSALQLQTGGNAGLTLGNRATTINSGITFTVQQANATNASILNNVIGGSGNLTLKTGSYTVNGANNYSGSTTLTDVMRLTLGSGAKVSTAGLTLSTGSAQTFGTTVDLGGNSQSVSSLSITTATNRYATTFTNGSLSVTGGNLTFNSGIQQAAAGSGTHSLNGLTAFAYTNATGTFTASVSATTTGQTSQTVLNLANAGNAGTNTITALDVKVGNSAANTANQSTVLGLGKTNTINTGTLTVGFYQGSGTMAFQPGVTNGSLVIRGIAGGSTAADLVAIGSFNTGNNQTLRGTLDLTNGALDANAAVFNVGYSPSFNSANYSASVTMPDGTVTAGTLALGPGSYQSTATFTQSGGSVTAGALLFGGTAAAGTPAYTLTYNLNGGILRSGTISTNAGTFGTSTRKIAWTTGTIANYDATTNLTIDGTSGGTNGLLTVELGGLSAKTLAPDAGRTITVGVNALLSSTGGLTVNGAGTVVINGSNSYSGGTTLTAGTLKAGNVNAFGTGAVVVAGGATVDLNSLGITNAVTNNGGTVSNAAGYAGTQTVNGAASIGNIGGTLVVANGGTATFNGALAAATTINAGGKGILSDLGSISALGVTNNGTFTIDRTGSSALATAFSGNGALVKEGSGTVTLTGVNTYAGATTVNAGVLAVNGSLGAGGVTVNGGAVFSGTGTIGGLVTIAGGTLAPGTSPGTMTMDSLSMDSTATTVMEIAGTAPGGGYDQVVLTGNVAYGGTLSLNLQQTFADNVVFELFNGFASTTGNFSSVQSVGSAYPGVTFTRSNATWTSTAVNNQYMQFDQSTGDLTIVAAAVPEPSTLVLAATAALTVGGVIRRRGGRGKRGPQS